MYAPQPLPEIEALAARTDFIWHQRFELAHGVHAPGASDVDWLPYIPGLPEDLTGASLLDIGTTNGAAAFAAERRGAARVLATDIVDAAHFGFEAIRTALGSSVEFRQLSVYELAGSLDERFDYVAFSGVLYHPRHPLLALDNVRAVAAGTVYVETAVCDAEPGIPQDAAVSRFYRLGELGGDSSNWFAPSVTALVDWCRSSGLEPERVRSWPEGEPSRALVVASAAAGPAEFRLVSYERPLICSVSRDEGSP